MPFPLLALVPSLIDLFKGKKEEIQVLEGVGNIVKEGTKGLLRSKTANVAHSALAMKLMGIIALPLDSGLKWGLGAVIIVEWAGQLYLRIKTDSKV